MILQKLAISLVFIFSINSLAIAGNEKGNGGYAVICKTPTENFKAFEILDYVEGRILRDLNPELGDAPLPYQQKIDYVLNRLAKWAPTRAQLYANWASQFVDEAKFLKGVELGEIGDTDHIAIPDGCLLKPVINQREPTLPNEKRYFINQDLWDQLDADNKAGLVLHELIYRELKTPTSVKVRYYNSIISSNLLDRLSLREIIQLHLNAGLDSIDINGVLVNINRPFEFYDNHQLKSAYPIAGSKFIFQNREISFYAFVDERSTTHPKIEFYRDGVLKAFIPNDIVPYQIGPLNLQLKAYLDSPITFWPNGALQSAQVKIAKSQIYQNETVDIEIGLDPYSKSLNDVFLKFYDNGRLASTSNGMGTTQINNKWVNVCRGFGKHGIDFFDNGVLKGGYFKDEIRVSLNKTNLFISGQTFFFKSGKLAFGQLTKEQPIEIQNRNVRFKAAPANIEFYEEGELRCGYLNQKAHFKTIGQEKPIEYSYLVCFTRDGLADPRLTFTGDYE